MNNNMSLANMLVARIDGISGGNYICTYFELEIKPCGLGSKEIWMLISFIGEHLDYFLFILVSRTGTVG